MKALNRKAEALTGLPPLLGGPYTFGDCCPSFLPGWEVGEQGGVDPCPWQTDLPSCHPCFWSAQVPDQTTFPNWLDACANITRDWEALCTVPD